MKKSSLRLKPSLSAKNAQKALRMIACPEQAEISMRFFKTAPGQYGFGDVFIGVSVPKVRKISLEYASLPLSQLSFLLKSRIHEDRLLGLVILVNQYEKAKKRKEMSFLKQAVDFYLTHRKQINNWDLVDVSVHKILGDFAYISKKPDLLKSLIKSPAHFERRLGVVGTYAYIRQGDLKLIFQFAEQLLNDPEDLMHKATGWMLREAGKKEPQALRLFIKNFGEKMPRTMLRYSIEKFSEKERKRILTLTRPRTKIA